MSDRSIAEIIGWRDPVAVGDPTTDWIVGPVHRRGAPTVDDLLTWLADEGWCVDLERLIDHPTPVFVSLRSNYHHADIDGLPMFKTALDACEAAVRAVADTP